MKIIIPLFNQQDYVADAIESAYKQAPTLVVNDGSTDNSLMVASSFDVQIVNQVNKGLASARNTGIMNATDEWLLFLDADDMLLDGAVEKLEQAIKDNPDVDIVAPSFKEFGISNATVTLIPNPTLEDFKVGNRIGYCAAIRRSALLAVGGYSTRMTFGYEDMHLWINLLTRGYKIVTIQEPLWLYRTKERSMIHEAKEHHEELMSQIRKDFPQW